MPRAKKQHLAAAVRARLGKARRKDTINISSDSEDEVTTWTGGVNYIHFVDTESENDSDGESEWSQFGDDDEMVGEELVESLKNQQEKEIQAFQPTVYDKLRRTITQEEWKKAESCRSLGYNKLSKRTKQRRDHDARLKEREDLALRKT